MLPCSVIGSKPSFYVGDTFLIALFPRVSTYDTAPLLDIFKEICYIAPGRELSLFGISNSLYNNKTLSNPGRFYPILPGDSIGVDMKIEYVHKLGNKKEDFHVFEDADIPDKIKEIIMGNKAFSTSKVFGRKGLGAPDEIEILKITYDDGDKKEFRYFNKCLQYMFEGGEKEKPVFQVFTYFMVEQRG